MNVNGVTSQTTAADYTKKSTETVKATDTATTDSSKKTNSGVVYEASDKDTAQSTKKQKNAAIAAQLKADAEARQAQLQSLVSQMLSKQGNTYGQATDMWQFLASGNYTVDAQTKAQAQKDIGEDGYWGVKQTSDRILDFAQALSNGDPEQMEKMRSAFQKGFKEATGAWGKSLPSISNDTYNAVMSKFDSWQEDYKNKNNTQTGEASSI